MCRSRRVQTTDMDERATKILGVLVAASLLPGLWASVEIMKDVTLGFGEALKHCREEVS